MYATMKKAMFLIVLALASHLLEAQEIPSRANEGVSGAAPREARRNAYYDLKLTREQQKKLQELNKGNREQLKVITADSTLSNQERRKQLQQVRNDMVVSRKAILTEEQYRKLEQNLEEIRKKGAASPEKNVVSNVEKNKEKDANGLSRDITKKTSKTRREGWNDLQMTGEQRERMKTASQDFNAKLQTIRSNISLASAEKQDQARDAYRAYEMEVRSILTAEQKSKWDDQQQRARLYMSPRELQNDKRRRGVVN